MGPGRQPENLCGAVPVGAIPQDDAFAILWGRGPPSRNRGEIIREGAHSVIKRVQEHQEAPGTDMGGGRVTLGGIMPHPKVVGIRGDGVGPGVKGRGNQATHTQPVPAPDS